MDSGSSQEEIASSDTDLVASDVPVPIEWFVLTGNRWAVVACLLFAVLVILGGLLIVDVIAVEDSNVLTRSFAALIGGNLTLITIVISINQLILSREFGSPDELHRRIQDMIKYRQEVAGLGETTVSPATPGAFLDFLVTILREETAPLRDETLDGNHGHGRADLEAFTDRLISQSEVISEALEETESDPFATLVIVLDTDFAADLYTARRIRTMHGESIPAETADRLDQLIEILEHIGVARQYLKSLYFQRELAGLSRKILYLGAPALVLLIVTTWVYGGEPGPMLRGSVLAALVVLTGIVSVAPLAVFLAYVLRIATIARRTASLVPFTIREESPL